MSDRTLADVLHALRKADKSNTYAMIERSVAEDALALLEQLATERASKAVLVEALKDAKGHLYNAFEPDNQSSVYKRLSKTLKDLATRASSLAEGMEILALFKQRKCADFTLEEWAKVDRALAAYRGE